MLFVLFSLLLFCVLFSFQIFIFFKKIVEKGENPDVKSMPFLFKFFFGYFRYFIKKLTFCNYYCKCLYYAFLCMFSI